MFKKYLLLLWASLFLATPLFAANLKVATVDVQFCMLNSKEGKKLRAELEKKAKAQGEVLKNKEKVLIQKSKELQESLMLSPDQKQRKQEELMQMQQELRSDAQKAQAQFGQDQAEATQTIIIELRAVVRKVAKEKGLDLVIEGQLGQGLLYSSFEVDDITEEVVKAYDKTK